jgi:quaternary ammonium compound-resistance protein SugE
MSWIFLITAGILEIGFTTSLKLTEGFTKLAPTMIFLSFSILSFWCLNQALETIPLGIAYAVWTGIGAAGTAFVGIFFFEDQLNIWKLFFLFNLIGSVFGLKCIS